MQPDTMLKIKLTTEDLPALTSAYWEIKAHRIRLQEQCYREWREIDGYFPFRNGLKFWTAHFWKKVPMPVLDAMLDRRLITAVWHSKAGKHYQAKHKPETHASAYLVLDRILRGERKLEQCDYDKIAKYL